MLSAGQHTLTNQPDEEDSYKHCILVKLTDSSAKAIEEYLRNNKVLFLNDSNKILRSFLNIYLSRTQIKSQLSYSRRIREGYVHIEPL